jgi:hypothetical protein
MNRFYFFIVLPLLCLFLLAGVPVAAQAPTASPTGNPLVDAQNLMTAIDSLKSSTGTTQQQTAAYIAGFFAPYFPKGMPVNYDTLMARLKAANNVYLLDLLPDTPKLKAALAARTPAAATGYIGLQAGLLSASSLSDVLGTFIADRFKQELEIAYLDKFKAWLQKDSALAALLPTTLQVLGQNDPFQYTTFFESLKEALESDIHNMAVNLGNFMARDPFHLGPRLTYYYPAVMLYQNCLRIAKGQNIYQVTSNLNQDPLLTAANMPPFAASLFRLVALVSRTLIDPAQSTPTLITVPNLQGDLATVDRQECFVGLLLLKESSELKKISFGSGASDDFYDKLIAFKPRLTDFITWFNSAVTAFQSVKAAVDELTALQNNFKTINGQVLKDAVSGIAGCISVVEKIPIVSIQNVIPDSIINNGLKKLSDLTEVAADVLDSNYGLALTQIITIIPDFIDTNANSKTLTLLKTYGGFAVSIAKAKTSADLESALSTAALPVGSYRIKRNAYWNISLNAWAGVSGGIQHYPGTLPAGVKQDNGLLSFAAPVGVAISWGNTYSSGPNKGKFKGVSNTILVNVIDIGSVTAFRLTHDTTSTLPNFSWQNILAPGIFYIYGFRNSPLSLGGGVQYGPQLRSISESSGSTQGTATILPAAISYRLLLAVDIPIFSFWTKTQPSKP